MKTDEVINGVLVHATFPADGTPYVWPEGVTVVGVEAFCPSSENENGYRWEEYDHPLTIPEGVTHIGNSAFSGLSAMNSTLTLPSTLRVIGERAFDEWVDFNQPFSIPATVEEIDAWAFGQWDSFEQPNSAKAFNTYSWLRI